MARFEGRKNAACVSVRCGPTIRRLKMSLSVTIVAYLALFTIVGVVFVFALLLLGRFVRPANSYPEKQDIYECGEPAIGSSFVQFDLRFYVVALLFIIFDVEVAFFFPWAVVFGKSTHMMDHRPEWKVVELDSNENVVLTKHAENLYREMGVTHPTVPVIDATSESVATAEEGSKAALEASEDAIKSSARSLAWASLIDIGAFFGVLMVGFAYVWKRGDLNWVHALGGGRGGASTAPSSGGIGSQ